MTWLAVLGIAFFIVGVVIHFRDEDNTWGVVCIVIAAILNLTGMYLDSDYGSRSNYYEEDDYRRAAGGRR